LPDFMIENCSPEVHPGIRPSWSSHPPRSRGYFRNPPLVRRRHPRLGVTHNLEMDDPSAPDLISTPPTSPRRTLGRGILLFRWVTLAWMTATAIVGIGELERPVLAWGSIIVTGCWTTWLALTSRRWRSWVLWFDLLLCSWLVLASGLVVSEGAVAAGNPFFATGYPLSAALLWGATGGPLKGVAAGGVLGIALLLSRLVNGDSLGELSGAALQNLAGGILNYLVAGGAVGVVSRLLVDSARSVRQATDALLKERERAARLAERERLAREIHDSVLQSLALVHKKGRELARLDRAPATEVANLAEVAGRQEQELRRLVVREQREGPSGSISFREALEAAARDFERPAPTVSSVGPIWIDQTIGMEAIAAVRQALQNVEQHAHASRVSIFAEEENGKVSISVRDDGRGFVYDEPALRRANKVGMLKSMKGRIEELGGEMRVASSTGAGTEVEFSFPLRGRA
jgi:signal transduction histidine kinase